VFELSPNAVGTPWTEIVLHRFCAQGGICLYGADSAAGLIMDASGNLFGTTVYGGRSLGQIGAGVVFELMATAPGTSRTEKVLHHFCNRGLPCIHGHFPEAGLISDGSGNLYGTTPYGGVNNEGVVFELVKSP